MDPTIETPPPGPETPPRKRLSRRAKLVGGLIAVLALAGTGWRGRITALSAEIEKSRAIAVSELAFCLSSYRAIR